MGCVNTSLVGGDLRGMPMVVLFKQRWCSSARPGLGPDLCAIFAVSGSVGSGCGQSGLNSAGYCLS